MLAKSVFSHSASCASTDHHAHDSHQCGYCYDSYCGYCFFLLSLYYDCDWFLLLAAMRIIIFIVMLTLFTLITWYPSLLSCVLLLMLFFCL